MAKFVANFCHSISDAMLIVGRAILFISCILMAIESIGILFLTKANENKFDDAESSGTTIGHYIGAVLRLALSMIGIYGAYSLSPKHLKILVVFLVFSALGKVAYGFISYSRHEPLRTKLANLLVQAEPDYKWYRFDPNPATQAWDNIQSLMKCCGLRESSDWNRSRPSFLASDVLPGSCCSNLARASASDGRCHQSDAYKDGCLDQFDVLEVETLIILALLSILDMALAAIAFRLAKPSGLPSNQEVGQYARFQVSVDAPEHELNPDQKAPTHVMADGPPPPPSYPSS